LANDKERGSTTNITIIDDKLFLDWERTEENPDIITVNLRDKLAPNQKLKLQLTYIVKIGDKFTKYGYDNNNGGMNLKTWYLTPADMKTTVL
jgi:hypothetical protein